MATSAGEEIRGVGGGQNIGAGAGIEEEFPIPTPADSLPRMAGDEWVY